MKAIIIGPGGYLGQNLTAYLLEKGYSVSAFGRKKSFPLPVETYHSIDIVDIDSMMDIDFNVDYVFLLSAITGTSVGFQNSKQFHQVNIIGLNNVLDILKIKNSNARLVFPSSRLVYRGNENPSVEEAEKKPLTIYAMDKLYGESLIQLYSSIFGIKFNIFRICVPFGSMSNVDLSFGTIGNLYKQSRENGCISIFGDGLQKRTFTHIEDIFNQIEAVISHESTQNEIFNIAGENYSILDVATMFSQKFNVPLKFISWPEIEERIETGSTIFDSSKISKFYKELKHTLKSTIMNIG